MGNILSSDTDDTVQSTHTTTHTVYDYTAQQQYRRQMDDYRRRMDDVIRENAALKHYNETLRRQLHDVNIKLEEIASNQRKNIQPTPIKASISTEHIKEYVDKMLENDDINIYGFPDGIEKQIYTKSNHTNTKIKNKQKSNFITIGKNKYCYLGNSNSTHLLDINTIIICYPNKKFRKIPFHSFCE